MSDFIEERPEAAYLALLRSGELAHRVERALAELASCRVCPRDCGVDRLHALPPADEPRRPIGPVRAPGQPAGRTVPAHIPKGASCFTGRWARVSSAFPHLGEEDCLRGWKGSGTIHRGRRPPRLPVCPTHEAPWSLLHGRAWIGPSA